MAKAGGCLSRQLPWRQRIPKLHQLPCGKYDMNHLVQFDSNIQQIDSGRQSTTLSKMMYARQLATFNQRHKLFRTIHSTQDNDTSRVPATTCNKIFCLNNLSWYSCTTSRTISSALEIVGDYLPNWLSSSKNGSLSFEHLGWDSWRLIPPYSTPFTSCERQRSNVLRNFISFVS